eukprot:TRINITY_DN389_c0_g2_i1.p1 TRINITY_DN389_c0_g2~~TRINITY_DN389_c0_g2_i1.p1  ORF type:complete len:303 (-),score=76.95 TRINITY_DN389_c0_g2_i1:291-1166(-)
MDEKNDSTNRTKIQTSPDVKVLPIQTKHVYGTTHIVIHDEELIFEDVLGKPFFDQNDPRDWKRTHGKSFLTSKEGTVVTLIPDSVGRGLNYYPRQKLLASADVIFAVRRSDFFYPGEFLHLCSDKLVIVLDSTQFVNERRNAERVRLLKLSKTQAELECSKVSESQPSVVFPKEGEPTMYVKHDQEQFNKIKESTAKTIIKAVNLAPLCNKYWGLEEMMSEQRRDELLSGLRREFEELYEIAEKFVEERGPNENLRDENKRRTKVFFQKTGRMMTNQKNKKTQPKRKAGGE